MQRVSIQHTSLESLAMSAKAGTDIFEIRNSTVSATRIDWE